MGVVAGRRVVVTVSETLASAVSALDHQFDCGPQVREL